MKIIWLADSESPHIQRWLAALENHSVEVTLYTFTKRRPRFLYFLDFLSIFFKLRKEQNAIVHAHFVSSYGVIASILPSRFRRIVSIWGSDVLVTPELNWAYRCLVRHALVKAEVRVTNSQYLAQKASEIADLPYLNIPFGLDLTKFTYSQRDYSPADQQPFVIGVVKRLHLVAGIDILLSAFACLVKRLYSSNLELVIVGAGPEEANLRELSVDLGIQDLITWEGWCGPEKVAEIYKRLNLVVFPSRVEGLGVSALEAMASGVPVLAARQGGLIELIGEDEQRGLFIELDPEKLAEQLLTSITNYRYLKDKAGNARSYIEQNYDISVNVVQLVDLYLSNKNI